MRRKIVISALIGVALLSASCGPNVSIPPAAITGDNSGGAIAFYQIWQMSDSYGQFYVQKISPEGDFLWGEKGVLIGSGYSEFGYFDSYAVNDGSGGAIVIWVETLPEPEGEPEPSYFQTHVARIDSVGDVEWQKDIPGIDEAIPDGSGGIIIAYDDRHDNLFVLKIDAEGNLPWGEDGVSLGGPAGPSSRDIASDGSGGVITVLEIDEYGSEDIVYAQRVDSEGNTLWGSGGAQIFVGPAEEARVVSDGAGGAIIAYMRDIPCEDGRIGYCDSDIYAQRIDAEGNVLWGPDGVPICVGPSVPNSPRIVTDGAGGAVIYFAFIGNEPGYFAFRARRIDADGHELWEEEAELWRGNIVSDGSGGVISVWDGGDEGSRRAQRLDAMGRELWGPDGTTLTLRDLHRNLVAPDGCGGVLISWSAVEFTGSKASEVSYYVQRVDAEGDVVWGDEGILLNPSDLQPVPLNQTAEMH
jgi:hypothetical protein